MVFARVSRASSKNLWTKSLRSTMSTFLCIVVKSRRTLPAPGPFSGLISCCSFGCYVLLHARARTQRHSYEYHSDRLRSHFFAVTTLLHCSALSESWKQVDDPGFALFFYFQTQIQLSSCEPASLPVVHRSLGDCLLTSLTFTIDRSIDQNKASICNLNL